MAIPGYKYCSRCLSWKPDDSFHKSKANTDGLAGQCKECSTEVQCTYKGRYKGRYNRSAYPRIYKPEYYRGRGRRPATIMERVSALVHGHPLPKGREFMPIWADTRKINKVYKRSKEMGADYQVDHVIPIKGAHPETGVPNVCGLHVHENLQIIPRGENARKKNYYTP